MGTGKGKYRVHCWMHGYDTLHTMDTRGGAVCAAAMHALLPCTTVKVLDPDDHPIPWREEIPPNLDLGRGPGVLPPTT